MIKSKLLKPKKRNILKNSVIFAKSQNVASTVKDTVEEHFMSNAEGNSNKKGSLILMTFLVEFKLSNFACKMINSNNYHS